MAESKKPIWKISTAKSNKVKLRPKINLCRPPTQNFKNRKSQTVDDNVILVNEVYFRYFSDLMANSFREIIEFSKNIPGFKKLNLTDQIALIKGSCIEMLFIKVRLK